MNSDDAADIHGRVQAIKHVKDAVEEELLRRPGVNGVGIGLKLTNGEPTGELAITVLLSPKRPLDQLAPDEVIPSEINGVKTDVQEMGPITIIAQDDNEYRPLRGGIQLHGGPFIGEGTLGCLARTVEATPKVVALTNQHVVFAGQATTPLNEEAGQPIVCSICSACCSRVIGRVVAAQLTPDVDAAIVAINPGLQWLAEVQDVGTIAGVHTVTDAEALTNTYAVQKRGRTTGLTQGTVRNIHVSAPVSNHDGSIHRTTRDQMHIVQSTTPTFAEGGDSGSVVLNNNREVVGLVYGAVVDPGSSAFGQAFASPIAAVQTALNIQIATATVANAVETIPAAPAPPSGQPRPVARPAPRTTIQLPPQFPSLLLEAQSHILQTPAGQQYAFLVQKHWAEIRILVNTNKRVATVWHRNNGPVIVQHLINALHAPDTPLPATIGERSLVECLTTIFAIFDRYGSAALRADLARHRVAALQLAGLSYHQFLTQLRAASV